ncbi:MAG: hypothetical protein ACJAUE_001631 [Alcanivorax sp.]|jgi:hypothetical protein
MNVHSDNVPLNDVLVKGCFGQMGPNDNGESQARRWRRDH